MPDNEYQDASEDQLIDEFEREVALEEKAKKKKRNLIVGGVLAGVVIALILTTRGAEPPPERPAPEPVKKEMVKPEPKDIESQIAKLQEQNLITEDFKAPGALMNNAPLEPEAQPEETEPEPAAPETIAEPAPEPERIELELEAEPAHYDEALESAEEPASNEIPAPTAEEPMAPAATPAAKEKSEQYSVQVLATIDALAALENRDALTKKGFDAWISTSKAKRTTYRVEAGEFNSIKESSGLSARMAEAGFRTRTAYVSGGKKVTLVAGTFQDRRAAARLNEKITKAGFGSKVSDHAKSQSLYLVRVGRYASMAEAARAQDAVKEAGFRTLGVAQQ